MRWTRAGLLFVAAACGGGGAEPGDAGTGPLATIVVTLAVDTLRPGAATRATASGRDAGGGAVALSDVAWSTSDVSVASVSIAGIVTAISPGEAVITAAAGTRVGQATMHVVPVPVSQVAVVPGTATLEPGATVQLVAQALDAAGRELPGRGFEWLSSDPARATVSSTGLVTAVAPGQLNVAAISAGIYSSAAIRVSGPPGPIAQVEVAPVAATLSAGATVQLRAILQDADGNVATDRAVTWRSLAPELASVSPAGLVTAIAPGSTRIEAVAEDHVGGAAVRILDPLDAITVRFAEPEQDDIVGDTLRVVLSASARYAIASVRARAEQQETLLALTPVGARGAGLAWTGSLDLTSVHYGPWQLVVTVTDERSNVGVFSLAFTRGTREGTGGAKLPPRNR